MHFQDTIASRQTGKWQRQQFSGDLADDYLQQITETMLLASRVRDDETRNLADRLRERVAMVGMSSGLDEADERLRMAMDTQQALIQRIGHIVRELDNAD